MPEAPFAKKHEHPAKREPAQREEAQKEQTGVRYAELHALSNFSFLRGASHPDELVQHSAELGYEAIAVTDVNTLAGIVRAHVAAKECGGKYIVGCGLEFQ